MKRFIACLITLFIALFAALPVLAGEAVPLAQDPVVEQRLIAIAEEVRCLVCQNESLAGSRADLAEDLRREIREMIRAGKTDPEILDFLVARYGDFVLYRPRVTPMTWMLWFGPFLLLAGGAWVLARRVRAGKATSAPPAVDEDAHARVMKLLAANETEART